MKKKKLKKKKKLTEPKLKGTATQRLKKRIKKFNKNKAEKGETKEALSRAIMIRERADSLITKILPKLSEFKVEHIVYLNCYPSGRRYNSKKMIITSESLRMNIYFCRFLCDNQCNEFAYKVYLCRDMKCASYPVCATTEDRKKVIAICKESKLHTERTFLNKRYNKFFKLGRIYRGLKKSPESTIKYLKAQKDKEDGKISVKKIPKKKKRNRKKQTIAN